MLALTAALSSAAYGQEQPAEGEGEDVAGYTALEPVTIFATLTPTSTFDYAGQVSVVEREQIQTEQAGALGDVLKQVPGVFVDGGTRRSGQAPTIRGFREEDTLVLLDGVKQSFISGHDGRIFVEPDLLKSVEVVKGPVSALYGSGALGGVIALTTVDAADFLEEGETSGVRVKAGYQSVNEEFAISTTGFMRSLDGRFDVVGSLTYRDSSDIDLGNGATLPEDEEIKSALVKGTAQLTPDLKFTTSWIHYDTDTVNPNDPQGNNVPSNDPTNPNELVNRIVKSDTVSGKLSYNPSTNPLIDGNLLVYWARNSSEERAREGSRITLREIETTGVNIDNRSRFDLSETAQLTFTYGAEYYIDKQTGEDNQPLFGGSVSNVPSADASYYGTFVQAELKAQQPLGLPGEATLTPGVRWDGFENNYKGTEDYDDYEDQAVSPRVGATYKPVPWLMMFGAYGEAFRAPSYTELYAQGIHFSTSPFFPPNRFISNPNLKPQDGTTIEGGVGFDFKDIATHGDQLTLKGSYWETEAKNYIDMVVVTDGCFPPVLNPAMCYSMFDNVPNAELDGIEVELKYDSARFFGGIAYHTIDGINTDTGEYLGSLYANRYIVDAGVKVPEWWSRFGARFTFAGEMNKVNEGEAPRDAYNLVDLYAVIEPTEGPLKGFRLDLGVDNVTDEAYELIEAGVYEDGRNYKAAVTWTYKW